MISFDLEAYWHPGPYLIGFEYIGSNLKSPDLGDPFFGGYAFTGSWAVTGETRAYRRRTISSGLPLDAARLETPVARFRDAPRVSEQMHGRNPKEIFSLECVITL